jgi:hypothetical protein
LESAGSALFQEETTVCGLTHRMSSQFARSLSENLVVTWKSPIFGIRPLRHIFVRVEELLLRELPFLSVERETLLPPVEGSAEEMTDLSSSSETWSAHPAQRFDINEKRSLTSDVRGSAIPSL